MKRNTVKGEKILAGDSRREGRGGRSWEIRCQRTSGKAIRSRTEELQRIKSEHRTNSQRRLEE
jgi:hypothetical protein